jgi:hypothetical protein
MPFNLEFAKADFLPGHNGRVSPTTIARWKARVEAAEAAHAARTAARLRDRVAALAARAERMQAAADEAARTAKTVADFCAARRAELRARDAWADAAAAQAEREAQS